MTIAAINPVIANMMLVAELDWLLAFNKLTGVVRRAIDCGQHPHCREQHEYRAEDAQLSQRIRTVVKNLWHSSSSNPTLGRKELI
jgi:hypothetical protein